MLHSKNAVLATALMTVAAFTATTGTSQAETARVRIPWTDQTVFALSPTDSYVAEWMGLSSGWTIIGGPATHIYAGSAGVFETDSSGNIWMYNGTPYSWTEIGGPGAEFAEGGGHLYGLGPDRSYVAEWNGTPNSWTIVGGPAILIWAGTDGLIAMAPYGTTEDVWRYNGTPNDWSDISTFGDDFAVGSNTIYKVSNDFTTVSQWNGGTSWTPILTGADDIQSLVGGDNGVYIQDDTEASGEEYFKYDGTPSAWTQIGDLSSPIPDAESRTSLYGVTFDDSGPTGVDLYSGSGTSWTVIGGPADPALAAGD